MNIIVHSSDPITIVGGSSLDRTDLKKSLTIAPRVVAADGGVRHLADTGPAPDAVIGDLDSLAARDRLRYADRLFEVDEQDTTDFEKVLQRVSAPLFLALGFLGGRVDHSFATLNVLARQSTQPIIVFGAEDILFRAPARLRMSLPPGTPLAVLPMGQARVSTAGLKWDLEDKVLTPDGLISSSNAVAEPHFDVHCDGPALISLPKAVLDAVTSALRAG